MLKKTVLVALVTLTAYLAEAKRESPKEVPPVALDGISYSAPHTLQGCVFAKSDKTGQVLWFRQVYVVKYDAELEKDVQDCFITGLTIADRKLLVTNEAGGQYELDPDTLSVTVLKGQGVLDRAPRKR